MYMYIMNTIIVATIYNYILLRLRIGTPKACMGLTISGPKQLSKKIN